MEFKMDGSNYVITGTPEEMTEFILLNAQKDKAEPVVEQEEVPAPEIPEAPKPAKKGRQRGVDWGKARALRNAGWTYAAIADDLEGFSDFLRENFPDMIGIRCYFGKGDSAIWFFRDDLEKVRFY